MSFRQAAETLLILTNMDPATSNALPAMRTPNLADLSAANIAVKGPEASPLQALVQDIMRDQQQRQAAAQVWMLCVAQVLGCFCRHRA